MNNFSYVERLGHIEQRVLDAEFDDLRSNPTSVIKQLWSLSKLFNLSQPQFLHLHIECSCTCKHPRSFLMSTCECKVDMLSAMMCDTSINSLQTLHIYLEVSTFTDNISLFPLFSVTFCSNPLSQSWGFFPFVIIKLDEINCFIFIIYYQKLFHLMKIFFSMYSSTIICYYCWTLH